MTALRVPPGRAGRQRLRRRLAAADRGADLLERKLHSLLDEQRERRQAAEASTRSWIEAAAEADRWLTRALAASGYDGLRQCLPAGTADVSIREKLSTGVRFPAYASCALPATGHAANAPAPDSAALVCAQAAYEDAVRAAVRAAVDQAAARIIDAAVVATRRQVRILRRHWIPALREALLRLDSALEQSDFEDGVRRRHVHAAGRTTLAAAQPRRDALVHRTKKGGG